MSYPIHLAEHPNVILIFCDQMRTDCMGAAGPTPVRTPALDTLARDGVLYENMIVQNPTCGPSRACLLTGRYCSSHRLRRNGQALPRHELTAAHHFARAGYHTALIGKLHLQPFQAYSEEYPHYGFEHFRLSEGPGLPCGVDAYRDFLLNSGRMPNSIWNLRKDGEICFPHNTSPDESFSGWVTSEGEALIRNPKAFNRPFFLNLSYFDPHPPFTCPEPYYSMYRDSPLIPRITERTSDEPPFYERYRQNFGISEYTEPTWQDIRETYYGMVTHMDVQIGRFLDALKRRGLYDSSLIAFISDHGEMLGDHDLMGKGPFHYDAITKVPSIIKFPKNQFAGSRVNGTTESIDLLPTLLQTAGLSVHPGIQGRSLLTSDGTKLAPARESALIEDYHEEGRQNAVTVRTADWKYTRFEGEQYGELFNISEDPNELRNLWNEAPSQRVQMADLLLERLISAADPLPLPTGLY